MTKHMPQIAFTPRLLQEQWAAQYLGISPSTLRELPIARKERGRNRLYDRLDLDAYADSLPYEGDSIGETAKCDEIFGGP